MKNSMARENLAEQGNVVGGDGVAPLLPLLLARQEAEGGEAEADHGPVQLSMIRGVVFDHPPPLFRTEMKKYKRANQS